MDIIVGIIGLVIGTFLWSNIIGSLLATLPFRLKLKKSGDITQIKWLQTLAPVVFAAVILFVAFLFSKPFFIGSLIAAVRVLFSIGSLKQEAIENFMQSAEYKDFRRKKDNSLDQEIADMIEGHKEK